MRLQERSKQKKVTMTEPCIFCNIISGRNQQAKNIIYQDKKVTVFLDRIQPHDGHLLVIPNRHIIDIFTIPESLAAHLFRITARYAKHVQKTFGHCGVDIYQTNRVCAGQKVFHLHIHIFPRKENDGLFKVYEGRRLAPVSRARIARLKRKLLAFEKNEGSKKRNKESAKERERIKERMRGKMK